MSDSRYRPKFNRARYRRDLNEVLEAKRESDRRSEITDGIDEWIDHSNRRWRLDYRSELARVTMEADRDQRHHRGIRRTQAERLEAKRRREVERSRRLWNLAEPQGWAMWTNASLPVGVHAVVLSGTVRITSPRR